MEITMVIMSVMGRMMESSVYTVEMVFSVLFWYLSLLLKWSFFLQRKKIMIPLLRGPPCPF